VVRCVLLMTMEFYEVVWPSMLVELDKLVAEASQDRPVTQKCGEGAGEIEIVYEGFGGAVREQVLSLLELEVVDRSRVSVAEDGYELVLALHVDRVLDELVLEVSGVVSLDVLASENPFDHLLRAAMEVDYPTLHHQAL
jgi:hypothetical protein